MKLGSLCRRIAVVLFAAFGLPASSFAETPEQKMRLALASFIFYEFTGGNLGMERDWFPTLKAYFERPENPNANDSSWTGFDVLFVTPMFSELATPKCNAEAFTGGRYVWCDYPIRSNKTPISDLIGAIRYEVRQALDLMAVPDNAAGRWQGLPRGGPYVVLSRRNPSNSPGEVMCPVTVQVSQATKSGPRAAETADLVNAIRISIREVDAESSQECKPIPPKSDAEVFRDRITSWMYYVYAGDAWEKDEDTEASFRPPTARYQAPMTVGKATVGGFDSLYVDAFGLSVMVKDVDRSMCSAFQAPQAGTWRYCDYTFKDGFSSKYDDMYASVEREVKAAIAALAKPSIDRRYPMPVLGPNTFRSRVLKEADGNYRCKIRFFVDVSGYPSGLLPTGGLRLGYHQPDPGSSDCVKY